jgi:hypothetical protein
MLLPMTVADEIAVVVEIGEVVGALFGFLPVR